jgi:hypothetical protein
VLKEFGSCTRGAWERGGLEMLFTAVDRMAGGAFARGGFMSDLMLCRDPAGADVLLPDTPMPVAVIFAARVWGSILEKRPWFLSRK